MQRLYLSLEENRKKFESFFSSSADYFFKYIKIFNTQCAVVMCEDLVDSLKLWQIYLSPLNDLKGKKQPAEIIDYMKNNTTIPFNPDTVDDFEKAMFFLTSGFALIIVDGINKAMVMPVQGYPARGVDKPTNEGNLRGSKESFTDAGRKNMGLIRRRIRSEKLMIETVQTGVKTKTEISLYYHKDYCPEELIKAVKHRIEKIDLPMVFEAGYISPFIDTTSCSFFQAVGYTERPDTFCAKICEGKVGIMIDGTPYAIIYPYFFHENFIANDDYTQRPYFASFIRIIRYIAFILATALPGFYVAFTGFEPHSISEKLIFYIYNSQASSFLPVFVQAVLITILLEIVKEAGLRLPTPIGSSVSIVSALIIGDSAIEAGIIGSAILIVCALSTISSFIIPSFYEPIIMLRLIFILFAGIFGVPGLAFATIFLLINIVNVNGAGYEYTNAFTGKQNIIFKDGILRNSWRNKKKSYSLKEDNNG